VQEPATACSN